MLSDAEKLRLLRETVDGLLNWALSNRGGRNEFVNCYTYSVGKFPKIIEQAKAVLLLTEIQPPAALEPLSEMEPFP